MGVGHNESSSVECHQNLDERRQLCGVHTVCRRSYFLQAVELDTPDRTKNSLRFQFNNCLDTVWPDRLALFEESLTQSLQCTFSLCTQADSPIVKAWPNEFQQFTDAGDVPVVAGDLETRSVP